VNNGFASVLPEIRSANQRWPASKQRPPSYVGDALIAQVAVASNQGDWNVAIIFSVTSSPPVSIGGQAGHDDLSTLRQALPPQETHQRIRQATLLVGRLDLGRLSVPIWGGREHF